MRTSSCLGVKRSFRSLTGNVLWLRLRLLGVPAIRCANSNSTQEPSIRLEFCKHVPQFPAICDSECFLRSLGFCEHPMSEHLLLFNQKTQRFQWIRSESASLEHLISSTFQTRFHFYPENRPTFESWSWIECPAPLKMYSWGTHFEKTSLVDF